MATKKKTPAQAPDVHATFGRNLKKRREQLYLSQSEVAALVGCTRHNISNIEGGKQGVALAMFVTICVALKCTPDNMLRGACL